jgi:hypothetical protein
MNIDFEEIKEKIAEVEFITEKDRGVLNGMVDDIEYECNDISGYLHTVGELLYKIEGNDLNSEIRDVREELEIILDTDFSKQVIQFS